MSSSSSSAHSSPMLTPYSSPMLTLAIYSQPHRPSSPAAHFPIQREADRVPPSIKRRTTGTPGRLSRSTLSSSTMDSPYDFGIRRLPAVIDEVGIVDDDAEYHSDVSPFELQPSEPKTRAGPPVRPKLQRRDTPIPPRTSLPTDRSPVQRPSTAFQSNLRPEADDRVFDWNHHRRDTPRSVPRSEWRWSLSKDRWEEWGHTEMLDQPKQDQEQPKRKGSLKSVLTGNVRISRHDLSHRGVEGWRH